MVHAEPWPSSHPASPNVSPLIRENGGLVTSDLSLTPASDVSPSGNHHFPRLFSEPGGLWFLKEEATWGSESVILVDSRG